MFDIVLFEPEIPPNTGNIIRLCVNAGARLHLVSPLGYRIDDRSLARAGLDYRHRAVLTVHADWAAARAHLAGRRQFACSTRGAIRFDRVEYAENDVFVFGPESRGLPAARARGIRGGAPTPATDGRGDGGAQHQSLELRGDRALRGVAAARLPRWAVGRRAAPLLRARVAREQLVHRVARRHALEEHRAHRARDRHVHTAVRRATRATLCAVCTPSATWPSAASICIEPLAAAEREADAAIAREVAGAGEDQIARAGQPHERFEARRRARRRDG